MKYSEDEIEIIAKSMYKAVKKALAVGAGEMQSKGRTKDNKDVLNDLMDPNFIFVVKDRAPPRKEAQMNKSCMKKKKGKSSLLKLSDYMDKVKKKHK